MALLYRHKRRHMVEEVKAAKQKTSGPFQQYPNNENGEAYPDDIYEQDESQLENSLDPLVLHETNTHVEHATGNASSLQGIKVVQITFVHSEQNEQGEITEDDEGATPAVVQITQELPAQKVDLAAVKLQANATVGEYFIENS
ncbi:hypothetical protein ACJMK2_016767 [Sinanodonta woodiana]|uniref:Uncharacterized protein n=1 Tax=Sinanodonta woodiana TaxID=1069815 RepID=A0ABD3UUR7_SINWO